MFSGKTRELERLVERLGYAGKRVQVFKPAVDTRFGKPDKVVSHSGDELDAIPVNDSADLLSKVSRGAKLVAIDEAQFLDEGIVAVIEKLQERGIKVLVAGLPTDFRGEPFGPMPTLLAKADYVTPLTAVCTQRIFLFWKCGREATRTQRLINGKPANYDDPVVVIGASEKYAPRCVGHHKVPGKPSNP